MKKLCIILVALMLCLLLLALMGYRQWVMFGPTLAAPVRVMVQADTVDLYPASPQRRRVGALTYAGGLTLRSADPHFGGLSALAWAGDGVMLALSDRGDILRFQVKSRTPQHIAVGSVEIFPLRDSQGRIGHKSERDSEAMLLDAATGHIWIATERFNRLYRYDLRALAAPARAEHVIPESQQWPNNGGPESLARLPDGRLLVISEEPPAAQHSSQGLVLAADSWDKAALRFRYHPPEGFRPTDALVVDDQWMLVLHRHFSLMQGVRAQIALVRLADIREGADVRPQIIAELSRPLSVDNMEGLAIERLQDGRFYLWLVSDDNFSPLQRTLLLRFLWDGPPAP